MEEKRKYPEIVVNIPMRLRYYLDPASILIGSILVCAALIYVGSSLK